MDQSSWFGLCAKLWHFPLTAEEWLVMAFNVMAPHLILSYALRLEGMDHLDSHDWLAYVLDFGTFVDCREVACIRPLMPWPLDESHGTSLLFCGLWPFYHDMHSFFIYIFN